VNAAPLDRDLTVDLAVIGGGFTGNAAALEAARRGASVCLMEAETFGHGGSGRNVGLVNAGLWLPPDQIVAQMGEAAATQLINVLADAPARVFALIEREAIDCEATRKGTLHLAHSSAGLKDLQNRFDQGVARGAPLKLVDAAETARRTGTHAYHGALWDARAGTIQPLSYCRGLARAAQKAGAYLYERSPVSAIMREGDLWVVTSNGHKVRAKSLLVATNAYHLGIETPFKPHFVPVSYCQFATAPMPERARERILAGGEGCWDTAMVMSSFRVDQSGRLIVGAIGNTDGPASRIHAAWARRKLRSLFPDLGDLPFEHAWRGRIAMTSDHVPKIISFGPNAYACFGYSGRGIGPGTVFGTQTAIALLEGSPEVLPVAAIPHYSERFTRLRAAYYEFGAALTHTVFPVPFSGAGTSQDYGAQDNVRQNAS
jgi:glycine/D-amino acid oxidase-like deaminating enzyme